VEPFFEFTGALQERFFFVETNMQVLDVFPKPENFSLRNRKINNTVRCE
jgi:hypothetical protein